MRLPLLLITVLWITGLGFGQESGTPFYRSPVALSAIPTPREALGFTLGQRPVRYAEVEKYFHILAESSPRVRLLDLGTTGEGKVLHCLLVSSEENIDRLDEIREDLARLGDPRITSPAQAREIISTSPALAWMMYNVHGSELSGCDAALALAYRLTSGTDSTVTHLLENTVVAIDPSQNPDGRERSLNQLAQWSGRVGSSDPQDLPHQGLWPGGRANHYLFDLNRDWFILSQPETVARVKAIGSWNPQLVVDAHEMGSSDTYFFNPPREPINPLIPRQLHKWWDHFARDQARAFDRAGWSYFTRDAFDEWYPGYGSSWAYYLGAVSILYEQASTGGTAVRRPEGGVLTFSEAVQHQYVSSLANITTVSDNRPELLKDFYDIRRQALEPPAKGEPRVYYLLAGKDSSRTRELVKRLLTQGIEVTRLSRSARLGSVTSYWDKTPYKMTLPAGTFQIVLQQPRGNLAKVLLKFDMRLSNRLLAEELKSIEKGKGTRMYEVGAWCLPMAFGVEALSSTQPPLRDAKPVRGFDHVSGGVEKPSAGYGFLLDYSDSRARQALILCFQRGLRIRSARKPFTIEGKSYGRGALLLRRHENDSSLVRMLTETGRLSGVTFRGVNTALTEKGPNLGGDEFTLLTAPRVALITGPGISSSQFGSLWYMLDAEMGLPHSLLDVNGLGRADLRDYNLIILPSAGSYKSLLGAAGLRKLRDWISDGGTLIGVGGTASFLADSSVKLCSVRERGNVLAHLEDYEKAARWERTAGTAAIDSLAIWEGKAAPASEPEKKKGPDVKTLKEQEKRLSLYMPRGVVLRVDVNPEHWLCFGAGKRIPTMVYTSNVFLSKPPVETAARFAAADNLRLSGLLWPQVRDRWAYSTYAAREKLGNGQVILFAGDPSFRSYFYGTELLLRNAILLGPGFGSRQPLPR